MNGSRPGGAISAAGSLPRLLLASFLMDGSFYLILTAVPLRAAALQATPLQLGILPVLASGVYVVAALTFGALSDRWPRIAMARAGAALRTLAALALIRADTIPLLMLFLPLLGIANGLFWPALQAAVGEMRPEGELRRNIGGFNVSWSAGKMLGFLCGGIVIAHGGFTPVLAAAAVLSAAVALILPEVRIHPDWAPDAAGAPGADLPRHAERGAWRRIGWLANFVFFGIGALLNYHYPKLLLSYGFSARDFGIYLGLIYLCQTLAFVALARWGGWHFRPGILLGAQALGFVSLALLAGLRARGLIWATAPGIGLGLGISYSSSIYYSLFREPGRGRSTGIHEALLGSGTFLIPFLAGAAAQVSGSLLAPYLFGSCCLAAGMAVEAVWARRSRGNPARPAVL